ncbi:hydantoinase B/oxoprolinase family protein [Elongatibacter sediminis]|uniref:Hydantoinase B/oxoprolinase family protein n=1 Tax=Elongatibacter sediminis TaxID=3119006 RepID=A0AAW9R8R1_9GAMM
MNAKIDPITTEVIRNAFYATAEDMSAVLNRSSYSPVIYECHDYGVSLYNENVELLAQAPGTPYFTGGLEAAVQAVVDKFGLENMKSGDVFAVNDTYMVGAHLNDVDIVCVYVHEGQPVGFGAIRAHWEDVGAATPGHPAGTTEIYQEGLRIPPVRIMSGGELVTDMVDLFKLNSRTPKTLMGDMNAMVAAARMGEKRFLGLIRRFGLDVIRQATGEIFEATEAKFRAFISSIPDGVYEAEGCNDNDSVTDDPVWAKVKVIVDGDRLTVDTTGSDRQHDGNINVGLPSTKAMAKLALAFLYPSATPEVNHGSFKTVDAIAEKGSIYWSQEPVAGMRPVPVMLLLDLILKALAPAIPDRVAAGLPGDSWNWECYGRNTETDEFWLAGESMNGGWGASKGLDGVSAITHSVAGDFRNVPIETQEARCPILVHSLRLGTDTGGAGQWRGGLNTVKEFEALEQLNFQTHFERTKTPQWGLFGGHDGAIPDVTVYPPGESPTSGLLKASGIVLEKGTRVVARTGGGGGYGNPLERDPEAVLEDVLNGYVSRDAARSVYGVVLSDADEPVIDTTATEELRRSLAASAADSGEPARVSAEG